jgi:hypothetical protein
MHLSRTQRRILFLAPTRTDDNRLRGQMEIKDYLNLRAMPERPPFLTDSLLPCGVRLLANARFVGSETLPINIYLLSNVAEIGCSAIPQMINVAIKLTCRSQ